MAEQMILVDENDVPIGTAEKMAVHRAGMLHRAFSVFVFHPDGRLLMQRRADGKYHSPGLWSNSACGHPRPGEDTCAAARRRLGEELGLDLKLEHAFSFTYRVQLGDLWEHEFDHVFVAQSDDQPVPDASEVGAWEWADVDDVMRRMESEPGTFTEWFPIAMRELHVRGYATGV
ncbi:MAG: isopentenyl-diphosphate Delta-isomerase [Gemmatimonadaceae bacterium]